MYLSKVSHPIQKESKGGRIRIDIIDPDVLILHENFVCIGLGNRNVDVLQCINAAWFTDLDSFHSCLGSFNCARAETGGYGLERAEAEAKCYHLAETEPEFSVEKFVINRRRSHPSDSHLTTIVSKSLLEIRRRCL